MTDETASLRDDLDAAMTASEATTDATPSPEIETAVDGERSEGRKRDNHGRFAAKAEKEPGDNDELPAAETEAPAPRKPPSSWKKEAQELFGKMPPEYAMLQDEIERREADFHKGLEQYRSKAQFADEMRQAVAPYEKYIAGLGTTPTQAVQHLFNAEYRLRNGSQEEKAQMFMQLARDYGVDLGGVATYASQVDPRVLSMQQELAQMRHAMQSQQAAQRQAEESALMGELQAFASEHEHLDAVREDMAALLQAGRARDLKDAYEKAVRLNPEISAAIDARQREAAEAQRREEARKAAAVAKAAAVSVKGSPSGTSGSAPSGSLRDALAAAFDGRM